MTSTDGSSPVKSEVGLSRTRSFPNVISSLLFNHRTWSSMDTEHVPLPPNPMLTTDNDQSSSTALSISGLLGSRLEQGSFNWVDPEANFSIASTPSSASSTSMRRSETWTNSLQQPNDPSHNAMRPANETSVLNGNRGISASGSSNLRGALQRSLSEVFGPNKIVIELPEEARHVTPEVTAKQSSAVAGTSSSPLRMSLPSISSSVSRGTPLVSEPGHTHSKPVLRRQFSLAAVSETDPTLDVQPVPSSAHPGVEGRRAKAMLSMTRAASVDENQNAVGHRSYEDAHKMAAGEMTSHDQVTQVPETAFSRPSRRFGIMEMLGAAGERKKVRNKDVNMVAPQSW